VVCGVLCKKLQNHGFQLLQLFGLASTLWRLGRLGFEKHWAPAAVETVELAETRPQQVEQCFWASFGEGDPRARRSRRLALELGELHF